MTAGPHQGTCVTLPPSSLQCSPSSICIPDYLHNPTIAQCCAAEESCTATGCEYRHPHFCPNGKNCGLDDVCVKDNACCPKQCVVEFDFGEPSICCAAGGYCTPVGCWYVITWTCLGKICGSDGTWTCTTGGECCPKLQACGPTCCPKGGGPPGGPKGDMTDTRPFVCVNENAGLCCRAGDIETKKGGCCAPGQINADGGCCPEWWVPDGHGCKLWSAGN